MEDKITIITDAPGFAEINARFYLRLAKVDEIQAIKEICDQAPYDSWPIERYHEVFEHGLTTIVICDRELTNRADNNIVGYLIYLLCLDEGRIINFAIDHNYQRLGLGRELMLYSLRHIQQQNINYALLDVRVSNFAAINLYTQMGFRILCTRRNHYTDIVNCDAYFMQLDLNG